MSLQASQHALYGLKGVNLSPQQRLVLILIADHINGETGWAWLSIARLVQHSGMKERAVQRALRGLREAGVLEVIERPGNTNMYRVITEGGVKNDTPSEHLSDVTNDTPTHVKNDTPPTPETTPRGVKNDRGGVSKMTPNLRKNLNQDEEDDDGASADQADIADRVALVTRIIPDTWADTAVVCSDPRLDVLDQLTADGWTARDLRTACATLPRPRANPTGLLARHLQHLTDTDPAHLAQPTTTGTPTPQRPAECGHGVPTGAGCHDCDQETSPWT